MGVRGVMPSLIVDFIIFGESVDIIEPHLMINIFFYFLVAIFPTAYAIFEYRLSTWLTVGKNGRLIILLFQNHDLVNRR